jgi:amidase
MAEATAIKPWSEISKAKREAIENSFPSEWRVPSDLLPDDSELSVLDWPETSGWFTTEELSITSLPLQELLEKLAAGKLSSVKVTKAYCKRAVAAHQLVRTLVASVGNE